MTKLKRIRYGYSFKNHIFDLQIVLPHKISDLVLWLVAGALIWGSVTGIVNISIKAALFFSICFIGLSFVRFTIDYGKVSIVASWIIMLLGSAATFYISQIAFDSPAFGFDITRVLPNVAICFAVTSMFYCVTVRWRIALVLSQCVLMLLTIIAIFVEQCRGSTLMFGDIFAIRTALSVASNYHFEFTRMINYALIIWLLELVLIFRTTLLEVRKKENRLVCIASIIICVGLVITGIGNYPISRFNLNGNGYFMGFCVTIGDVIVEEPEGYSPEEAEKIADRYVLVKAQENNPTVIMIMNETFSDLDIYKELNTNEEIIPFFKSLTENTIKGYALTSVHGGGTSTSEYEVLSGNSAHFTPEGVCVYQTYLKNPSYSMVSQMKNYEYECIAMHPYEAGGWNRNGAYPLLGFDRMYFVDDFPQQKLVRNFVSDQEMYEKIIEIFEEEKNDQDFIFGVTMQNHSGYDYEGENYTQTIELEGYNGEYPQAEQYLSLLNESDKALEYLINYFSSVEEDVVILFFGDHHARIEDAFIEELLGKSMGERTMEEKQLQYTVPFFIWANYDIEEQIIKKTSLNYLSSYLYNIAGLPLPPYNQFLKDMEKYISAMNTVGFYSANDSEICKNYDEANEEEKKWLTDYYYLVYNSVFDYENLNETLFPLWRK